MVDLELTEITMAGVQHLENWLTENGYSSTIDIWQPGTADIKADGKGENILIQAKTVLHPNEQLPLNGTDKFALKEMAARQERIPYIAYLVIDDEKNLVGEIIWERLN
jgi:hypothetical protein